MSETLTRIRALASRGEVLVSRHGSTRLADNVILPREMVDGLESAVVVEDYPQAQRGPSVLVLQQDSRGRPVHVLWGIPKGAATPAVLVTAYRPDPRRWSEDFTRRMR
jgi:hypothetical protein